MTSASSPLAHIGKAICDAELPDSPPVFVRTLDHVTLIVRDLEASRKFYCDLLGMQDVPRPGFSFPGKWFQAGATQIHLILEHSASGPAGFGSVDLKRTSQNHHFAFQVDDAVVAAQALAARGVTILAGPKSRPDGFVQTFITDPDGHVVELCSNPPPRA